jgi:DNA polymerase
MTKQESLQALEEEMQRDTKLPLATNLVFGEGSPDAAVLFIGEAPGAQEDIERRPFVGRGGQLLRSQIRAIGWREEDVYITNIVKRRPPENRDPLPEEIEAYKPYLTRQIEIIAPKLIVPLGRFAMMYFLPEGKISRDQGRVFSRERWSIVPIFHPAAALRNPESMKAFIESCKQLPHILAKGAPAVTLPEARKAEKKEEQAPQEKLF